MEAVMGESTLLEEQSSFGIKKIVDCKIGEGGQQMYKVKWQPTWEPAENLASCQHLIDEFWSFVNTAKINEEVAQQHRKRMRLEQGTNNVINIDQNFNRMSENNKADVQRLIARAGATSVGSPMILSPSNILMTPQCNQQNNLMDKGHEGNAPISPAAKEETDDLNLANNYQKSSKSNFPDDFDNPYVRIAFLCKICSKEQSKKFKFDWKRHYNTHDNGPKPYVCEVCGKDFAQRGLLNKHMRTHGNVATQGYTQDVKQQWHGKVESGAILLD